MAERAEFEGDLVRLDLLIQGVWKDTCSLEMYTFEDDDLARVTREEEGPLRSEPIFYFRCKDLSDADASWIQADLAAGRLVHCRLRLDATVEQETFRFDMAIRIREIYRCSVLSDDQEAPEHLAHLPVHEFRWMITGIFTGTSARSE